MLDRAVVEEFLDCQLEELEIEIPKDISKEKRVEAFCQYVEDDYYEWLKDNFKSFFDHCEPDWEWVREKIRALTAFAVYLGHCFGQLLVSARSVTCYAC